MISYPHVASEYAMLSELLLEQSHVHIITLLLDNLLDTLLQTVEDRKGKQTGLNPVR